MTKIFMVAPTFLPIVGGSETHINDLITALAKRDFKIDLMALVPPKSKTSAAGHTNLKIITIPVLSDFIMKFLFKYNATYFLFVYTALALGSLIYFLKNRGSIDIIHAHSLVAAMAVFPIARFGKVKSCVSNHGIYFSGKPTHQRYNRYAGLMKYIYNHFDHVFAIGKRSLQELQNIGIAPEKILQYRYWVDHSSFTPHDKALSKAKTGLTGDKNILFVGRLTGDKGIPVLIRAAGRLTDFHFYLIGAGDLEQAVKKAEHSLSNLHYLGKKDSSELPSYYCAADITVLLSTNDGEGIPRALIESLSCGTPVVCTNSGGAGELAEAKAGLMCGPTVESFQEAASLYFSDNKIRDELKSNATLCATELYGANNISTFLRAYQSDKRSA